MTPDEQTILDAWRALQAIRNEPALQSQAIAFMLGDLKSRRHERAMRELQAHAICHQDALLALLVNWRANGLTEDDAERLLSDCSNVGSAAREHNLIWVDFMTQLRQHRDQLPAYMQHTLDWYLEVHGW